MPCAQPLPSGAGNPWSEPGFGHGLAPKRLQHPLNNRHRLVGHVLDGRYRAQLAEGSGNGCLRAACDYVHLNPVRAKLLAPEERLPAHPWSRLPSAWDQGNPRVREAISTSS